MQPDQQTLQTLCQLPIFDVAAKLGIRQIAIVESEKTAIICHQFLTQESMPRNKSIHRITHLTTV